VNSESEPSYPPASTRPLVSKSNSAYTRRLTIITVDGDDSEDGAERRRNMHSSSGGDDEREEDVEHTSKQNCGLLQDTAEGCESRAVSTPEHVDNASSGVLEWYASTFSLF
jgi:hypothetical protein